MEEPSSSSTPKPVPSSSTDNGSGTTFTLPKQLEGIKPAAEFPGIRHRWNTNEEIASILIAFDKHKEWMHVEMKVRPPSGSMLLYSRKKVRYRKDGYCWKKRKDGKNIREDHMKLKVQGLECIYGSYVHSDILPTFHRRCYWLLQNPDIVIVHYLNVPYPDNTKMKIPVISQAFEKKEWTKEELIDQLRPMFSTGRPGEESEQMIEESVEALVRHLLEYHENCDKTKPHKCDKPCDTICSHSNNMYKLSPRGTLAELDASRKTEAATCCGAKTSSQMTIMASLATKGPEISQTAQSQGCSTVVGVKENVVVPISQSQKVVDIAVTTGDLAPMPYILSLGHLPSTSRYLVVGGQVSAMQTPITVSAACHVQPISHLITQLPSEQLQNNMHTAHPHQHLQAISVTLPAPVVATQAQVPSADGSGNNATTHPSLVPNNTFVSGGSADQSVVPMQVTVDETIERKAELDKGNKLNLLPHYQRVTVEDVQTVIQSQSHKLLPQLQTITAEDVQTLIQSHNTGESKNTNSLDLQHCSIKDPTNSIETDSGCLNSSLGSTDYSFDNLDLLDFPDVEKLVNDLSTSESRDNFNTRSEEMAGPIPMLNCSSCVNNQRQQVSQENKRSSQGHLNNSQCQIRQQAVTDGQMLHHHQHIPTSNHSVHIKREVEKMADSGITNDSVMSTERLTVNPSVGNNGAIITDYCPEWSYTEGGCKMLVVGSWLSATAQYVCVFDGKSVPTRLVQPGVLKCCVPAHAAGCISLHVTCDGTVFSNSVPFEYKDKKLEETTQSQQSDWFSFNDDCLKLLLIDRLAELEQRLTHVTSPCEPPQSILRQIQNFLMTGDLEEKLVWHVKKIASETWSDVDPFPKAGPHNMTLLHLAAALGYSKLIQTLVHWRSDNPCWVLEYEVDARCQDDNACTPLMWACGRGHTQAAVVLYHWNSEALHIQNNEGLVPLIVAQKHGHLEVIRTLDKLLTVSSQNSIFASGGGNFVPMQSSPPKSMDTPLQTSTPLTKDMVRGLFKSPPPVSTVSRMPEATTASSTPTYPGEGFLIRRQSDQALRGNSVRKKLNKRFSVDLLPVHSISNDGSTITDSANRPIRETNSEPQLSMATDPMTRQTNPMLSDPGRDLTSPDMMMQAAEAAFEASKHGEASMESITLTPRSQGPNSVLIQMDTDEVLSSASASPLIDVENLSSDDEDVDLLQRCVEDDEDVKHQMVTLAKQIIAAMPERIKLSPSRTDEPVLEFTYMRERSGSYSSIPSQPSPHASSYEEDSGISTPMGDGLAFDEYRYTDLGTPASSLSPDSTCLPSPYSPYSFSLDSPPPTTAEFTEYFNAPATFMEKDFSQLTLSDIEQRKLYEAAKVIQSAYRQYRDKQQLQQQKEMEAAVLIQKYYRRYKQYAYYKKMTQAAVLIQSQFRSYYAQKRFKKSRDAAVVIQNQYRTYKEHERLKKGGNQSVIIQQRFRSHYQRKSSDGTVPEGHIVQLVSEAGDRDVWKIVHLRRDLLKFRRELPARAKQHSLRQHSAGSIRH
ncbi:calmodulin-binding transcription activator 2-like isoform X2 [Mizuhopecten yessoensis]|uniref:calmodulin-binding transcription activator 2-like isoform X2 n=1 Tax=Mizuhopecten yessoensis TaxID=6573 RepID=UPI000B45BFDA|nr:calmodulin-binding transcription activator 2-like isoform X2 [Mizuhopecten yessoensis]